MSRPEIPVPNAIHDPWDNRRGEDSFQNVYGPNMGAWFEQPGTPETRLQALMEAAPGDTPERSREEIQELREAVADCLATLTHQDRYIIDSYDVERLSYSQLAERLGCSKSQAEREHKRAYKRLSAALLSNPTILERHPMLRPTDWNSAAERAVRALHARSVIYLAVPFEEFINRGKQALTAGWDNARYLNEILQALGSSAFASLDIDPDHDLIQEVTDLLCDRHAKYGAGNINEFKEYGLLVRMSDKVARIRNGAGDFADETTRDAYLDLVGYGAIAWLLDNDYFDLPLAAKEAA